MLQFLVIAVRNVVKNRTRSLILGGAVASVTALMVVMMSLASGVQRTILDGATALFSGHVNVAGFYKLSQTSSSPVVTKRTELYQIVREAVPEAKYVVDRLKGYGKMISETASIMVPTYGVNMENEREILGRLKALEGDVSGLAKPGSVAIFASHAKKLEVKVGDTVTLSMPTYRNMSNTRDVRVVAILRDMGLLSSFSVFLHHQDLREIYQLTGDTTGQLQIYLRDPRQLKTVEDRLRRVLADKGFGVMDKEAQPYWMKFDRVSGESWTGQKLDVTTWEDETSFAKWVLDILHALTFILVATLLGIIVVGMMNALWMSIRERTGEVGTLRAIGLQRRKVLLMFLLEALTLSSASALAGILGGLLISGFLNLIEINVSSEAFKMFLMSDTLSLSPVPGELFMAFAIITLFMTIGALYPAYQASKLKPITAINHMK